MYLDGLGVEQDYEKALEYYQQAADMGLADALSDIGDLYRDGMGVEQSNEKAAEYYQKAVELGYADAQASLDALTEKAE